MLEVWADKQKDALEDLVSQAWYTAAFTRVKKLQTLETILALINPPPDLTPEEKAQHKQEFNRLAELAGNRR